MSHFYSLSEYQNPILYDLENKGDQEYQFIQPFLKELKGPILDLACGTGRITLLLAAHHQEVTGVDLDAGMLAEAQRKAQEAGLSINWIQHDMTQLDLPEKQYALVIMTGNAFQHLLTYEEQDRFLKSVSEHTNPNALLIFDTRNPILTELSQEVGNESGWDLEKEIVDPQGRRCEVFYNSTYHPLDQIQHYQGLRKFWSGESLVEELRTSISLRYTHPKELVRLLDQHGWKLLHLYGSWSGAKLQEESCSLVVIAQKKA